MNPIFNPILWTSPTMNALNSGPNRACYRQCREHKIALLFVLSLNLFRFGSGQAFDASQVHQVRS
jgi:hypothetical protein